MSWGVCLPVPHDSSAAVGGARNSEPLSRDHSQDVAFVAKSLGDGFGLTARTVAGGPACRRDLVEMGVRGNGPLVTTPPD